jgi:hypothetical protein
VRKIKIAAHSEKEYISSGKEIPIAGLPSLSIQLSSEVTCFVHICPVLNI